MAQQAVRRARNKDETATYTVPITKCQNATDTKKLMDDIDQILEENAEEFVQNYKQAGGQ